MSAPAATAIAEERAVYKRSSRVGVLPGFRLTLGITLTWLSLIVLLPLGALILKTGSLVWAGTLQRFGSLLSVGTSRVSRLALASRHTPRRRLARSARCSHLEWLAPSFRCSRSRTSVQLGLGGSHKRSGALREDGSLSSSGALGAIGSLLGQGVVARLLEALEQRLDRLVIVLEQRDGVHSLQPLPDALR